MKAPILASLLLATVPLLAHEGSHPGGDEMPPLDSNVSIQEEGAWRLIASDNLPNHQHGRFPNAGNPNRVTPLAITYRVPLDPTPAADFTLAQQRSFGIALNGVQFDPFAAEFWQDDRASGWQYEALGGGRELGVDHSHAHIQPSGKYHYHGMPNGLLESLGAKDAFKLLGYAADGYPIYSHWSYANPDVASSELVPLRSSWRVKSGSRPAKSPGGSYDGSFVQDYEYVADKGDLDLANGRQGVTPEYPDGTYYYVITPEYPFVPRYFRGDVPRNSEQRVGGAPVGGPPARPRGRNTRPETPLETVLSDQDMLLGIGLSPKEATRVQAQLQQVRRELDSSFPRPGRDASIDDRRAHRNASATRLANELEEIRAELLTPPQNTLLTQQVNRLQGFELLLRTEVRVGLDLTDVQYAEIYGLIVEARAAYAVELTWNDLAGIMSSNQRRRLQELIGPLDQV